jgi:hypothetical protein
VRAVTAKCSHHGLHAFGHLELTGLIGVSGATLLLIYPSVAGQLLTGWLDTLAGLLWPPASARRDIRAGLRPGLHCGVL